EFKTFRSTDNRFYWLSAGGVRDAFLNEAGSAWNVTRQPAFMTAHIASNNQVIVNTRGVEDVTLWFPAALVNFEKPVTVRMNGQVQWNNKALPQSLVTLLEDFYERSDRQRLMLAKLRLRVR